MLTEKIIIQSILKHGPDIIESQIYDKIYDSYILRLDSEKLAYPMPKEYIDTSDWFIPTEYKNMDIEKFLFDSCPKENYQRLSLELKEYQERNLLDLLKTVKYIVDILRKNKVVWGVGRGSSVASYVLFLLGVHKIDSVKYNLPIEEFFKGEQNG